MRKSIYVLVFWCCSISAPGGAMGATGIPRHQVYLSNPFLRTMNFAISCDLGESKKWAKRRLAAQHGVLFGCGTQQKLVIRIPSDGQKKVTHFLEEKKRYEFFWDAKRVQWDVHEIAPRR